ncbi:acetate--CoA ligase family protein [Acuticoccus sediminis]|uniref:acetate--CoA ligase family protein n=1 Tax=Acuticoccus sediminis TaxID=2184697 RepID=UPI001CFEE157|nr:acetate--CoA ligase family protein [Acuticoccus sediminis]
MTRDPYPGQSLRRLFNPKSIAIVGVSSRETSFGARFVANLYAFTGTLYLINPKRDELYGRRCYPSLSSLPEAPDCVVIATDLKQVEPIFEECIAVGAGGAVVIASGFAETGDAETAAIQTRLAARAAESGVRLNGPNTIGFVAYESRCAATFLSDLAFERCWDRPRELRRIGFISQSGALGLAASQAAQRGVYFSSILTCGNSADVNLADCIAYLASDEDTAVIGCLLEGMPHPRQIETAIRGATEAGKPVVLYKMAKGEEGARAAASHTGNLAGSEDAYRTMVERAGGVFVESYEELLEVTAFFGKAGTPAADGTVVIATSGGAAIMAADAAELAGVPLPQPNAEVSATLAARIPEFGSARNPCDVTAQVINDMESLEVCIRSVMGQAEYNSVIVPHVLAYETSLPRIALMNQIAGEAGKPIIVPWLTAWLEGPGSLEVEEARHLILTRSMNLTFKAIRMWTDWHARRGRSTVSGRISDPDAAARVAPDLAAAGRTLAERDAKRVLSAYGVPVVTEERARTAEEARGIAERLAMPLVMKIDSPDLPHKTEVGGIALDLSTPDAVESAFTQMMERVAAAAPSARLDGVLLQPMIPKGVEIVVGATVDAAFGPIVVVGLGGVLVELLKDSVAAPAPVTPGEARDMLGRLRGRAILEGFRDLPAVDVERLADIVARVSEFAADHAGAIAELDVNPLICRGTDIIAVDALIVTAGAAEVSGEAQVEPA